MTTDIEININGEEYLAKVEYFFYSDEESSTGEEYCNIETIRFYNNIATEIGYPILMEEECSDFIYQYYPIEYSKLEDKCLKDFKWQQKRHSSTED